MPEKNQTSDDIGRDVPGVAGDDIACGDDRTRVPGHQADTGGDVANGDEKAVTVGGAGPGTDSQVETENKYDPRPGLIAQIVVAHRLRMAARRQRMRIDLGCQSVVANALGARAPELDGATKAAKYKAAAAFIAAVPAAPREPLEEFVSLSIAAAAPFASQEAALTKRIRALAQALPVWAWAAGVKGISANGIGILIGVGGDPGRAPSPSALRKYLGLAPTACYSKSDKGVAMVPRSKKSLILFDVVDPALRQGPYAEVYQAARARIAEARSDMVKGEDPRTGRTLLTLKGDRIARRKVADAIIEDYWRAWRLCGAELDQGTAS